MIDSSLLPHDFLKAFFYALQGLDLETLSLISPTDVRPGGFLPVFRSGSCSEIGPKSYMEDEHVCVDNLIEHLGGRAAGIPAPGAFYGVSSRWHLRSRST